METTIVMESKKNFVFQVDSDIVQETYTSSDNYLITYDQKKQDVNTCAVYFSSNYTYYPNNTAIFRKEIVEKNKFEWFSQRFPRANKHIFIRDIFKQWYLKGINNEFNSIETLAVFLRNELEGYKAVFIGSSAGGFIAVLLGGLLQVDRVYSFNGQCFITDLLDSSRPIVDPILFKERYNPEVFKYYNVKPFIKKPERVYYFYSSKSDWDVKQYLEIKNTAVNSIAVASGIHGIPFLTNNLKGIFSLNDKDLNGLSDKIINPIVFSIQIVGVLKTFGFLFKLLPNAYKRWIYNPLYNFIKRK